MAEKKSDPYLRKSKIIPRMLGVELTAEYLGLSVKTLRNRSYPKSPNPFPIKPKRIGRRLLWDRKEIDAWLDSI